MSTHPDSIIVSPDKKELLIPLLMIKNGVANFEYVKTENFLIPGKPGLFALLFEMPKNKPEKDIGLESMAG